VPALACRVRDAASSESKLIISIFKRQYIGSLRNGSYVMSWDSDFVRPIVLPNKIVVTTLRQVLAYISEHPEDQQNSPAWHKARECTRIRSDLFGSRASRSCRHFNETDKNRLTKLQVPSRSLAEKICDPKLRLPPLKQNPEKFSGRGTFEAERSSGPFDSSHHSATANVAPAPRFPEYA
jgi:hypothetical protein